MDGYGDISRKNFVVVSMGTATFKRLPLPVTIPIRLPGSVTAERASIPYSTPLTEELVRQADCVIVLTAHRDLPYAMIAANASLVVDTRNALRGYNAPTIVRLSGRVAATSPVEA